MTDKEKPNKPIEKAVALKYDGDGAPKVTATGQGEVAKQILALAKQNDIPLYQDEDLTGLLASLKLGDEIPVALYQAVAEVIAFAYQVNSRLK